MQKLLYHLVFGFFYAFSLLPWRVLYLLSDFAAFLLRDVLGYRRKVVADNIAFSFPDMPEAERRQIARKFYTNFTDNWIETIKLISVSKENLNRRITGNFEVFYKLHAEGKSVQCNLGHFFNWEIMTLHTGINQPFTFLTVYLPQSNPIMDRLINYVRSRWGNPQLPATDMARAIIPWRKKQFLLALGADQSPANPEHAWWLNFLGRPAPFPKGPEKFARSMHIPVVMMTTTRKKRGHYHYDYYLLAEDPKALPEGELMRLYVRKLEENIRLQPELYLWSHKRWKHQWQDKYSSLWVD